MKITTTFWSDEVHEFSKLLYIKGNTKEIMFKADLNDKFATFIFFKQIAKFVKSSTVRKTIYNSCWEKQEYYQFATIKDGEICPIKWYDLIIDEKTKVSHDIAFETTLIEINEVEIPLGLFPNWAYNRNPHIKFPKYREFNMKARAYKFIANQIKNKLFK